MGIGSVFECESSVADVLDQLLGERRIRRSSTGVDGHGEWTAYGRGFAKIVVHRKSRHGKLILWLTYPGTHALNPLLWYTDARLSNTIEQTLFGVGGTRVDWDAFAEDSQV